MDTQLILDIDDKDYSDVNIGRIIGRMQTGTTTQLDAETLFSYIRQLWELLDEADQDDFYGTEGWRHRLGLD